MYSNPAIVVEIINSNQGFMCNMFFIAKITRIKMMDENRSFDQSFQGKSIPIYFIIIFVDMISTKK